MPLSWLVWWWFLSLSKRKIKSYRGEGCKHKSSLSRGVGGGGCRPPWPAEATLQPVLARPSCTHVAQAPGGKVWALDTGHLGRNPDFGPF